MALSTNQSYRCSGGSRYAGRLPRCSTSSLSRTRSLRVVLPCLLSLVALRSSASAFQSPSNHPARRTISPRVFSTEKPTAEGDAERSSGPAAEVAGFGESVPYIPLNQRSPQTEASNNNDGTPEFFSLTGGPPVSDEVTVTASSSITQSRSRNLAVAIASFTFAITNYIYQLAHPITAIEILATMQSTSAPVSTIGNNGKPTVIDFWAPWCENCKVAAPTLQAVEKEYGDRVNFVMVNADDGRTWPLVQEFGVDSIPHLAFVSGEGDVETALIGPTSRNVLRADIDALLNGREEGCEKVEPVEQRPVCHDDLPYKMYDAFGSRPENRRVNFVER